LKEFRGSDTLIPILEDYILDGTEIVCDFWGAYCRIPHDKYDTIRINKKLGIKDPKTGLTTNPIEGSWRAAKATMTSAERKKSHIPGNLAKYIFFKRCSILGLDPTIEFFRLASTLYDARKHRHIQLEIPALEKEEIAKEQEQMNINEKRLI
jgi:hypothetical protein